MKKEPNFEADSGSKDHYLTFSYYTSSVLGYFINLLLLLLQTNTFIFKKKEQP
jgi:hypothetical protein